MTSPELSPYGESFPIRFESRPPTTLQTHYHNFPPVSFYHFPSTPSSSLIDSPQFRSNGGITQCPITSPVSMPLSAVSLAFPPPSSPQVYTSPSQNFNRELRSSDSAPSIARPPKPLTVSRMSIQAIINDTDTFIPFRGNSPNMRPPLTSPARSSVETTNSEELHSNLLGDTLVSIETVISSPTLTFPVSKPYSMHVDAIDLSLCSSPFNLESVIARTDIPLISGPDEKTLSQSPSSPSPPSKLAQLAFVEQMGSDEPIFLDSFDLSSRASSILFSLPQTEISSNVESGSRLVSKVTDINRLDVNIVSDPPSSPVSSTQLDNHFSKPVPCAGGPAASGYFVSSAGYAVRRPVYMGPVGSRSISLACPRRLNGLVFVTPSSDEDEESSDQDFIPIAVLRSFPASPKGSHEEFQREDDEPMEIHTISSPNPDPSPPSSRTQRHRKRPRVKDTHTLAPIASKGPPARTSMRVFLNSHASSPSPKNQSHSRKV